MRDPHYKFGSVGRKNDARSVYNGKSEIFFAMHPPARSGLTFGKLRHRRMSFLFLKKIKNDAQKRLQDREKYDIIIKQLAS